MGVASGRANACRVDRQLGTAVRAFGPPGRGRLRERLVIADQNRRRGTWRLRRTMTALDARPSSASAWASADRGRDRAVRRAPARSGELPIPDQWTEKS